MDTTETPSLQEDFRDTIKMYWQKLPITLQSIVRSDEHEKVALAATKNMLLSGETVESIQLATLSTLLGIIPYRDYSSAIKQQTNMTERDIMRVNTYIQEHLFTPHAETLDLLAVNTKPIEHTPEKKELPQKEEKKEVGVVEAAVAGDQALQKKFASLPKLVQETITSGAIALQFVAIPRKYAATEEMKKPLGEHILKVLVGTETMGTFKTVVREGGFISPELLDEFLLTCEEELFKPVRKSILQSLEQTG